MADEALFLAAYLAERWELPLAVINVAENEAAARPALLTARRYLEAHQVQASYIAASGAPGNAIREACAANLCDLIIMGGYRHSPVLHMLLNSTVDQMLRQQSTPILICR
jgi:nucleotide-binding universal stress UspA family protein